MSVYINNVVNAVNVSQVVSNLLAWHLLWNLENWWAGFIVQHTVKYKFHLRRWKVLLTEKWEVLRWLPKSCWWRRLMWSVSLFSFAIDYTNLARNWISYSALAKVIIYCGLRVRPRIRRDVGVLLKTKSFNKITHLRSPLSLSCPYNRSINTITSWLV